MNTVRINLSFDQIKEALRQLAPQEKLDLWRQLDSDIDRSAISRRFDTAIKGIRKAYSAISEEEVMSDALKATHESRHKPKNAKNRP